MDETYFLPGASPISVAAQHYRRVVIGLNPNITQRHHTVARKGSVAALDAACKIQGETKTDAVNRAIVLYQMLLSEQVDGGTFYLRSKASEIERVRIL